MSLQSLFVAKVVTKKENKILKVGTAYPLHEGVVITAYHVIPDINHFDKTYLKWLRDDDAVQGRDAEPCYLTEILYKNKEFDVLIAKCKTPDNVPSIFLCPDMPEPNEYWESLGYPKSGIDYEKSVRLKDPAGGRYLTQKKDHWEQHLGSEGGVSETNLWKGISGAPVFTVGTNKLTAIITKVPDEENPQHKDRIYVTSVAYLLETDDDFKVAVNGSAYSCQGYIDKQQQILLTEIKTLHDNDEPLYKALITEFHNKANPEELHQVLINSFQQSPAETIERLRLSCKTCLADNVVKIEVILLCLLSQRARNKTWGKENLHDLHVRTRLLCELYTSARYETTPDFTVSNSGHVIGVGAIEDTKDVGFNDRDNALQKAEAISYALYKRAPFSGDLSEHDMDKHDWKGVNTALKSRRKNLQLIRYEIDRRRSKDDALLTEGVQKELHKILSELPIILFGQYLDGDEHDLDEQVKLFYEQFNVTG